jgi:long-chain acyl-CoA synthetase
VAIDYLPEVEAVTRALDEVRPTILTAVPRFYERVYAQVLRDVVKESATRRRLFRWAVGFGKRSAARSGLRPLRAAARELADLVVYRRIRRRFGGRLRLAISGGAALPAEVADLFQAVGVPIHQAYGPGETFPLLAVQSPGSARPRAAGRPLANVEVRIADDGEILVQGPGVMLGYWQNEAATAAVRDPDGWLHTGDRGHLDADGCLHVDRDAEERAVTVAGA